MVAISIFFSVLSGIALNFQKVVNAALGKKVGSMESSFINHAVGALFGGVILIVGIRTGHIYFTGIPGYLFLGGSLGVFMVCFVNYAIPIIGVMATLICLIISQLTTSLIIDHVGLINGNVMTIGSSRIIGIILIILGAVLVLSPGRSSGSVSEGN